MKNKDTYKKYIGIYAVINLVDDTVYVGRHQDVRRRLQIHFRWLRQGKHYNPHLQAAFDRDGESNFGFALLEECSVEELADREDYWIRNMPKVYNVFSAKREHFPEHLKAKISAALKGRTTPRKGTKLPEEWKRHLRESHVGMTGRKHSEETKKLIREKALERWARR